MSFNNQIDKLIEKNKHLKAVNMTHYDNPFLLKSETAALNELVVNTLPSSRAEVGDIEPNDSHILGSGLTIYEPSGTDAENLSRHVMNEVYTDPERRREIEGYTMLKSFGDDRNVIYKSNTTNTILYGIRGTKPSSGSDWLTDLSIASKALRQILPFDKRDYLEAPMKERYDNANNIYRQLRELYPKSKIIMGGHSLGNSVGLDILYKHQADNNIELYGYNGFYHPVYTGKKDPRNHPQRTEGDIVSWWNSDKAKTFKTPVAKGVQLSGALIVGGALTYKYGKIGAGVQSALDELGHYGPSNWARRWDNAPPAEHPELMRELDEVIGAEDSAIMSAAEDIEAKAELDAMWDAAMGVVDLAETDVLVAAGGASAAVASLGLTAVMALLLGYGFYSHLSGHFELEKNRFIYKKHKPPRIKTGF